ncbi:MAG: transglycosylase domain-containing protein, partial [Acidimicrobiales bacterium]
MRNLLRLVVSVVAGAAVLATAAIVVPVAIRGIWRHGATSSPRPLAPLTSVTETGSTVYAANGQVLATLSASVTKIPVRFSQLPKILITAVLDTEDHRFYEHGGVDVPSEIRALFHDSAGGGLQGGSDITQQLVKQVYLNSQRTITRKIKEAFLAIRLQKMYTKNEILDAYLNTIYLGDGAYGVEAAARAYWNEPVRDVTLPQAAMLAGLIQDPSGYDPVTDPVLARIRRTQVLGRMLHYHDITPAEYNKANAAALPTSQQAPRTSSFGGVDGYYVAEVENELLGPGSPLGGTASERYTEVFEGGLKIYTNLKPALQADAIAAVRDITPPNNQGYQEALVSIDPHNGDVVAMVPGQDYATEKFDIVTQGLRQPGSGFKLFTLLPALEQGDSVFDPVDATSP